jgi:2-oxoglutarate ferredoxin oxidoreductase subunit alpha
MVIGAGWAGARAVTATSGPGLSLMAEAAGLAYFAEVPAVIWNVQRVGPSTGLPTRTMQGDLTFAAYLSHGDTKHILLFPSTPAECFEFGQTALDLAERIQTLVIVMSDLDLGMNLHGSEAWKVPSRPFDRGKVLDGEALDRLANFARYADTDGDGIGARTLPGTAHAKAAYFARGTGHNDQAQYSEDPDVFKLNMDRLSRKWETAKELVPKPVEDPVNGAEVGIIAFGSSDAAVPELRAMLEQEGLKSGYMRIRAFPFTAAVGDFLSRHPRVYVVEQNRDGQMRSLLANEYPQFAARLRSSLSYDGWPLAAVEAAGNILNQEKSL